MGIALFALAGLAAALLLLAVPFELALRCRGMEDLDAHLRVGWLFGLVRVDRRWPRRGGSGRGVSASTPAASKARRRGGARALALLRQDAFRRRLLRLLGGLLRALHVHEFALHLRLGLGDPADTGRLWAAVGPLGAALQGRHNVRLQIEPEFIDAVLEFDARGRLTLIPLQYLALALAFVLSPASIRAWRSLRTDHG